MAPSERPASRADDPAGSRPPDPTLLVADGWTARYTSGDTPWDLGGPHPELAARLADGRLAPPRAGARALVPGCGRGHDALALAEAGWAVTAIDFAAGLDDGLADGLAERLARAGGGFLEADALEHAGTGYALVWEHTFFCALPPERRADWGRLADRALAPDGRVAALLFPVDKPVAEGGPPHRTDLDALRAALGPAWRAVPTEPLAHRVERRQWGEAFALLERA